MKEKKHLCRAMQHRLDFFSQFQGKTTGLKIIKQDLQGVQTGGKKSVRFNKNVMRAKEC